MNTKVKTYLPLFSGFYCGLFEPNFYDEFFEDIRETGIDFDFDRLTFDYDRYYLDKSKQITSEIENALISLNLITECNFEELISPKYYNYSNDSINVEIELTNENIKNIQSYLIDNKNDFDKYLEDNYTSYDGFISSYSNEAEDWANFTNNFTDFTNNHYLGSILNFILINEEITEVEILWAIENLFYTEYLEENNEENKTFLDMLHNGFDEVNKKYYNL